MDDGSVDPCPLTMTCTRPFRLPVLLAWNLKKLVSPTCYLLRITYCSYDSRSTNPSIAKPPVDSFSKSAIEFCILPHRQFSQPSSLLQHNGLSSYSLRLLPVRYRYVDVLAYLNFVSDCHQTKTLATAKSWVLPLASPAPLFSQYEACRSSRYSQL